MANTVRSSISIPADLKARMDEHGDGVNWSTVACKAFEQKVGELITAKGAKAVEDVIARLKASKGKTEEVDTRAGREFGRKWAEGQAEYDQLHNLTTACLESNGEWDFLPIDDGTSAWTAAEVLVFQTEPDTDGDRQAAHEFWTSLGLLVPNRAFVMGFMEGAMEVWDLVKDKV